MYEDDVRSLEHALVIQGGSVGSLGCWSVCNLKNVCVLWAVTVFYQGSSAFNRDLDQWDVATVTSMFWSKSIRILENDLA